MPATQKTTITAAEIASLEKKFKAAVQQEISTRRFTLSNKQTAKTLSLRAAVTELQPGNPALFGAGYLPYVGTAITASKVATGSKGGAGNAIIQAEILDSVTRERFYAIIDEQTGTLLNVRSGMTRWGHVELAFRQWSKTIREAISK